MIHSLDHVIYLNVTTSITRITSDSHLLLKKCTKSIGVGSIDTRGITLGYYQARLQTTWIPITNIWLQSSWKLIWELAFHLKCHVTDWNRDNRFFSFLFCFVFVLFVLFCFLFVKFFFLLFFVFLFFNQSLCFHPLWLNSRIPLLKNSADWKLQKAFGCLRLDVI